MERRAAGPALGRRERNKLDKRARIKAAARKLFSSKGFAATTTQEIAREADIGAGTLFLYVRSKEEALILVFRDDMDGVCARAFATVPAAPLLDQLVHVYRTLIDFHAEDEALARVFVKEVMFVGPTLRQSILEFVDNLAERSAALIEGAKRRGEIAPEVPARVLAENLFAAYLIMLQRWLGLGRPLGTAEHLGRLRDAFTLQLQGLAPSQPKRRPQGDTRRSVRRRGSARPRSSR